MVTIYDITPTFATANLSHFQSGLGRILGVPLSYDRGKVGSVKQVLIEKT